MSELHETMARFQIMCPKCHDLNEVSFENIAVGGYGSTVQFRCVECDIQHMLGGIPDYRELKKDSILYINF